MLRRLPLALLVAALAACTSTSARSAAPRATPSAATGTVVAAPTPAPSPQQLPRGGRAIFPRHVVVAYYGTAGSGALGVLGETGPEVAARRTLQAAIPFQPASGKPVLPAFELITTVAAAKAGPDGSYSTKLPLSEVMRYVEVARRNKMLVILDFQPGRAEFLDQVKEYEQALLQPEVGVALDPEWKLTADQRPLRQIGVSSALPINAVSSYLAGLTLRNRLPEKIFMIHQFKTYQLPDRDEIVDRPGLATVLHVDGFGSQYAKRHTYDLLASRTPQFVNAFKLFYDEDVDGRGRNDLMTPAQAMALRPQPQLITYQ